MAVHHTGAPFAADAKTGTGSAPPAAGNPMIGPVARISAADWVMAVEASPILIHAERTAPVVFA